MNDQDIYDAEFADAQGPQTTAVAVRQANPGTAIMSVDEMHRQVQTIQQVMAKVMQSGEHYGVIPGCGDKPTLLQPGAQKLAMTFGFSTEYRVEQTNLDRGHREYQVRCRLVHRTSGQFIGEGVGCCSTMESKYRWRRGERKCPACGKETIIKGKAEYGGGWVCFAKKGGCGAKFNDGDRSVEGQNTGRVENPDVADTYNTVLKMAKKRACVDAVLTATAASDMFTQDLEDLPQAATPQAAPPQQQAAPPQQQTQAPPQQPASQPQQRQQPAPQQQPEQPAANNGADTLTVESIETKSGEGARGPWELWKIKLSDGQVYSTFDATHSTIAGEAHEASSPVTIRWKQGKYGRDLDDIQHAGDSSQAAPQQQPAGPAEHPNPVNVTITGVTTQAVQMTDGSNGTLYRIVTDKGNFGCYDDAAGQAVQAAHADNAGLLFHWQKVAQGYLVDRVEPIPF